MRRFKKAKQLLTLNFFDVLIERDFFHSLTKIHLFRKRGFSALGQFVDKAGACHPFDFMGTLAAGQ